jgi:TatD DNase family protein
MGWAKPGQTCRVEHMRLIHIHDGMIDSHLHLLEMKRKGLKPERVMEKCFRGGLSFALDIGISGDDLDDRLALGAPFPNLYHTTGLYPGFAENDDSDLKLRLDLINEQATHEKVIGIGEIGLDFHWNYGTKEKQIKLFTEQIEIANSHDLPVIIHNRKADSETYDVLQNLPPKAGGIMHCFSSDLGWAKKFYDLGFHISFCGNLTYKNAGDIMNAARALPNDAILVETDSPYLSPQKVRGEVNHPGNIGYTYEVLAEVRCTTLDRFINIVSANFFRLFHL